MICEGPRNAKVILLGEAPGHDELRKQKPFSGASGWELDKMLKEANLSRAQCFLFNVIDKRPVSGNAGDFFSNKTNAKKHGYQYFRGRYLAEPDLIQSVGQVMTIIKAIQPNVVVALGDLALWALTGESGITKWRGSIMESLADDEGKFYKVIPTFNPAFVLRSWPSRQIMVTDLRRVFAESFHPEIRKPHRSYLLRPTFDQAVEAIRRARGTEFTNDIEFWNRQIACVGFGFNTEEAACIPIMSVDKPEGYWTEHEERVIVRELRDTLCHPESRVIFQNGHYDCQRYAQQWGFVPKVYWDTMIAHHVMYPELRKSLDFMASMLCKYYLFWKEDGKNWDASIPEEQYWQYNCDDCLYTKEVKDVEEAIIKKMDLERPLQIQMDLFMPTLKMMLRGVKIDLEYKNKMKGDLQTMMRERSTWFETILGHPLNPLSNHPNGQMRKLFYDDLRAPVVLDRKTKRPSLNDEALEIIKRKKPALIPLCNAVIEYRSLNTFSSTFADAKLSEDGRVKFSINITGTKTYRFSTNSNIDDIGMNTQNIPKGSTKEE